MRFHFAIVLVLVVLCLLAGCARYPATPQPGDIPPRTLYCEMSVTGHGQINPNDYYFLALGVDQTGTTGPVPVTAGLGYTNGWGTISPLPGNQVVQPPFFVQIHGGAVQQYLGSTPLGSPYRYGTRDNNQTIWIEIDQRLLDPLLGTIANPIVQLNWITMETLTAPIDPIAGDKQYDGLGRTGNSYLQTIPLMASNIYSSDNQPGSPYYEPTYGPDETTTSDPDIDIAHWAIEVRIR